MRKVGFSPSLVAAARNHKFPSIDSYVDVCVIYRGARISTLNDKMGELDSTSY